MAKVVIVEDNTDRFSAIIRPKNGRGGLYLGSQQAAKDINLLKSHSIVAVITIAGELNNKYPPAIAHMHIKVQDQPLVFIYEHFDPTYTFIKKKMMEGNVFVHCRMGISRSASLVIAYLMRANKWPYEKAYAKVKSKRGKINPNEGFVIQLRKYEKKILQSQKDNKQ